MLINPSFTILPEGYTFPMFEKGKMFEAYGLIVYTGIYKDIPVLVVVGEAQGIVPTFDKAVDYAVKSYVTELIVDLRSADWLSVHSFGVLARAGVKLDNVGGILVVVGMTRLAKFFKQTFNLPSALAESLDQAVEIIRGHQRKPQGSAESG